jgi:hypothetical protein
VCPVRRMCTRELAIGEQRSSLNSKAMWMHLSDRTLGRVWLVRRNQDEGGDGYFSPWSYKRNVWPALAHA